MSGNGYFATKTYRCGRIGEKVKFFVSYTRLRPGEKSSPAKIAGNANSAARKLARAVNENFLPGDGWVALNYPEERYARVSDRAGEMDPELPERDRIWFAAQHELELLMDRARRALRKQGIELRYIAVTSDLDGKTGESVRVHHHIVCPAECVEVIKEKWGLPPAECKQRQYERLWNVEDYTPLAEYMMKQVRYIPNAKKYTPSRNLMRSEPSPRKVISGARLRPPKGARLIYADPYTGERDCQYIRYLLPPEKWTGAWKGKGNENPDGGGGGDFSDVTRRAGTRGTSAAKCEDAAPGRGGAPDGK